MKVLAVAVTTPSMNHCHWFGVPVDLSVKATVSGAFPDVVFAVKEATTGTGGDETVMVAFSVESEESLFATHNVTL